MLAAQPVWQAGEPMKVTLDYDGPWPDNVSS